MCMRQNKSVRQNLHIQDEIQGGGWDTEVAGDYHDIVKGLVSIPWGSLSHV